MWICPRWSTFNTTLVLLQSRPNQLYGTYIAQITERTAIQILIPQLYTMLTVIHLPQSCLSPVSNHFSRKCVSYGSSSAAVRADQGREQGLCVRRNTRHKAACSLIGWKTCHSSYCHLELNQSPQFNDTRCTSWVKFLNKEAEFLCMDIWKFGQF